MVAGKSDSENICDVNSIFDTSMASIKNGVPKKRKLYTDTGLLRYSENSQMGFDARRIRLDSKIKIKVVTS